jgi:hypothetical protein
MDILPIDMEILEANEAEDNKESPLPPIEEQEEEEQPEQEEIFIKPPPKKPPRLNKNGKPRKALTDAQIENLRVAREKSATKRRALKEAKDIEKAEKRLKREMAQEEKNTRIEEQNLKIRLAAQMKLDAEKAAHFSEERLAALMEKTLDNYIEKKKKMKPKPREVIPYPTPPPNQTPQAHAQHLQRQQQPVYNKVPVYNHRSTSYQDVYNLPPARVDNPMDTLFGNFGD